MYECAMCEGLMAAIGGGANGVRVALGSHYVLIVVSLRVAGSNVKGREEWGGVKRVCPPGGGRP